MSWLITSSIVGAVDWLKTCPPSWRDKALVDLTNQLSRVWVPEPEDKKAGAGRGHKFEDAVYAHARTASEGVAHTEHFLWFVSQCQGGVVQKKVKRYVTIDDAEYCLYGKIDVWFPDRIDDIKTTANYRGRDHYLRGFQHKLYCFITRIGHFRYLVAEFAGEAAPVVAHHVVEYTVADWPALEVDVVSKVREFVTFLRADPKLFELYTTKFSLY